MSELFNTDKIKEVIEGGMKQAQEFLKDTPKVDAVLEMMESKLQEVPNVGSLLADVPLSISMVKSYITKEYDKVSTKVVATIVSAFIYLIKKKDLVPDNTPLIGHLDDIAVLAFALKFIEPELREYGAWRDAQKQQQE